MTIIIALDTGVLGRVTNPEQTRHAEECRQWLREQIQQGARIVVPETAYYEVRRSLELSKDKELGIRALDTFVAKTEFIGNREIACEAARNWATARQEGRHTPDTLLAKNAHLRAIDSDTRLAAEAKLAPKILDGVPRDARLIVATTNVRDIGLFIEAKEWREISVARLMNTKREWQPPQQERTRPKEAKVLLDRGIQEGLFKEGMPRHEVVSIDRMKDLGERKLNGAELVQTARDRGFQAVITTNWSAIAEAEKISERGKPVYVLALNGDGLKNEVAVRKAMPSIENMIREELSQEKGRSL